MQIYVSRNDEQLGPYSREEVTSYLEKGSLTSDDFAWHEDLADWKPLGELIQVPVPPTVRDVPSFEKVSDRSILLPAASSKQVSASSHLAKIVIVILLIAGGGYYYLAYGAGKVAARQWREKAVSAYNRLVSAQPPALTSQKESAGQTGAPAEITAIPEQGAPQLATPVPDNPRKMDWAAFVASPNLWPKMVVLTTRVSFPVVLSGRVAGSVTMPGGTPVKLDGILGDKVRIEYQGGVQTVSAKATDLEQRLLGSGITKGGIIGPASR
jgi:hypothetical protein